MIDDEWQQMAASGAANDNEWQQVVQQVVQRVTTSGITNGNEWCKAWKQMRVMLGFRMKQLCNVKLQYIQQRLLENRTEQNICSSYRTFSEAITGGVL